jgi:hypothetical protein
MSAVAAHHIRHPEIWKKPLTSLSRKSRAARSILTYRNTWPNSIGEIS